jgi:uncharacterized repeat protein (TIGR03803 family)
VAFQIFLRIGRHALLAALVASAASSALRAETVLYRFQGGGSGQGPDSNLVADGAGNLYGTTYMGGADNYGAVFELTAAGAESVIYSFQNGSDGDGPRNLVMDGTGNLYGISFGGKYGYGTIFEMTPAGRLTTLYSFQGGTDGGYPLGQLVVDQNGDVYGTTEIGGDLSCASGQGCGTVFMIKAGGRETALYAFEGVDAGDGDGPYGGVIMDGAGNLFGTTRSGGTDAGDCVSYGGCGTVFELDANGQEKVLYAFQGGSDGMLPEAGLVADGKGNLYGDAAAGCNESGFGCVFKLTPAGAETILHRFEWGRDGVWPEENLILDGKGNLYGMTQWGGDGNCKDGGRHWACGVVFKISSGGTETILHTFRPGKDGTSPAASLLLGSNGLLYGVATDGGSCRGCGVIFSQKR